MKKTTKPWLTKHGISRTRFYRIWQCMKQRCYDKNHKAYHRYGGAGKVMSDRWLDIINFKEDMYKSYLDHVKKYGESDTSIDRINNDLGYSKDNCKWATRKEQANNTRNNVKDKMMTDFDGSEINIVRFAKKYNFPVKRINHLIMKGLSGKQIIKINCKRCLENIIPMSDFFRENKEVLNSLSIRNQEIMAERYGIHNYPLKSLEEVSKKFGVTRERIRQLINKSLKEVESKLSFY